MEDLEIYSLFKINIEKLDKLISKLIYERFSISISELDELDFHRFQDLVDNLKDFSMKNIPDEPI